MERYVRRNETSRSGDVDNTMAQLEKSAEHHEGQILYIRCDPSFDKVSTDARFVALEKCVGLIP